MYEKNYQHGVTIGETYNATAEKTPKGVFVTVSHLQGGGERATEEMFFSTSSVKSSIPEAVELTKA